MKIKQLLIIPTMLCMTFSLFSQVKKGRKFEMYQPKYVVYDDTEFKTSKLKLSGVTTRDTRTVKIDNPFSYSEHDIIVVIEAEDTNIKLKCQELIEDGYIVDTLVLAVGTPDIVKWNGSKPIYKYKFEKLKKPEYFSDYMESDLENAMYQHNATYKRQLAYLKQEQEYEQQEIEKAIAAAKRDSIKAEESRKLQERQRIEQEERKIAQAESNRKQILGDLYTELIQPKAKIQTKSFVSDIGIKFTYEYYVNDEGYEVYHGKYTKEMIFNNYRYYSSGQTIPGMRLQGKGNVTLNGKETMTCHYFNGILHGKLTYSCDVKERSWNGNPVHHQNSYNLEIYKGFLTGNFTNLPYNSRLFTGKATNGILDYTDYTESTYHGKVTSISSKPAFFSYLIIKRGDREYVQNNGVMLGGILASIPAFRFPLIGSNE